MSPLEFILRFLSKNNPFVNKEPRSDENVAVYSDEKIEDEVESDGSSSTGGTGNPIDTGIGSEDEPVVSSRENDWFENEMKKIDIQIELELAEKKRIQESVKIAFESTLSEILAQDPKGVAFSSDVLKKGVVSIEDAESACIGPENPRVMNFYVDSPSGRIRATISNNFCSSATYGASDAKACDYFTNPNFSVDWLVLTTKDGSVLNPESIARVHFEHVKSKFENEMKDCLVFDVPPGFEKMQQFTIGEFFSISKFRQSVSVAIGEGPGLIVAAYNESGFDSGELLVDPESFQLKAGVLENMTKRYDFPSLASPESIEDEIARKLAIMGFQPSISYQSICELSDVLSEKLGHEIIFLERSNKKIPRLCISAEGLNKTPLIERAYPSSNFLTYTGVHKDLSAMIADDEWIQNTKIWIDDEIRMSQKRSLAQSHSMPRR